MEIWIDSAEHEAVRRAQHLGFLHGVTTNPALIRQAGQPLENILENLLAAQPGPVAVQVTVEDAERMVQQTEEWRGISERLIIKIPATREGYRAMGILSKRSVPVMATVIFHPHQALLAAKAGAHYVAPYVTRMQKAGIDSMAALATMRAILAQHGFKTRILAASLSSLDQIVQCAELGLPAMTLKEDLFEVLTQDSPQTRACLPM
ncbi:MAG: hypothetical protein LLG04_01040 [Parachlamydia sp.]|nr:hypothetical protein [Parachlamydia sp.]